MEKTLLTPQALSERWEGNISVKTLANWRCSVPPKGPRFRRVGNKILYPLEAVIQFEAQTEVLTPDTPPRRPLRGGPNSIKAQRTHLRAEAARLRQDRDTALAEYDREIEDLRRRRRDDERRFEKQLATLAAEISVTTSQPGAEKQSGSTIRLEGRADRARQRKARVGSRYARPKAELK